MSKKNIGISKDYNVFELNNALSKRDVLKANRIVNYKAGKLNGVYQNFSRKGNLISETNYKQNKKHGDVKTYSKRGKLISHLVYKDGVKIKDEINKIYYNYSSPKQKK